MANRIPLVFDTTQNKIKELPSGDNLNMSSSSINDAINITASGTIAANTVNTVNLNIAGNAIAEVAKTNSYTDLSNLPALFDGDYNSLTNKPSAISADWADITNKPTIASKLSQLVNDTNFITNAQVSIQATQVAGLSAVATGGSWTNLTDANQLVTKSEITGGTLTIDVNNTGDLEGSVYSADGNKLLVDGINKRLLGPLVGNVTGNVTGDVTGDHIGNVYSQDGAKQVLYTGVTQNDDALFRGNIAGQVFSPDLSTLIINENGNFYGDLKGSVFSDDSSVIVDSINNTINADLISATTLNGNLQKLGSSLNLTSDSGIQLLPNGSLNVPNATTITINASSTIGITATDDLTLTSSSGDVIIQDHISITALKTLVSGSADFDAFKTAIAGL